MSGKLAVVRVCCQGLHAGTDRVLFCDSFSGAELAGTWTAEARLRLSRHAEPGEALVAAAAGPL